MSQVFYQQIDQGVKESTTLGAIEIPSPRTSSCEHGPKLSALFTTKFWSDLWSIEILTVCCSISCFAALVVILMVYDHKTVPQLPMDVTFNAVISVLATATKSSILLVLAAVLGQYRWLWLRRSIPKSCTLYDIQLLDDASRGPWGALILLWHLRGRWLVSIGAIATILAIAVEPFVQQIPSYVSTTQRLASADAAIPRAFGWEEREVQSVTGRWQYPIRAAVAQGIYYSRATPLNPSCPSGNCTWDPFQTLAMCHKCIDVTDLVKTNGSCRLEQTLIDNHGDSGVGSQYCNYMIGEKQIALGIISTDQNNTHQYGMPAMTVWPAGNISTDSIGWTTFNGTDLHLDAPGWEFPVFAFYRIMQNTSAVTNTTDPGSAFHNVTKCAFNFCIQEYDVSLQGTGLTIASRDLAYAKFTHAFTFNSTPWVANPALENTSSYQLDSKMYVPEVYASDLSDALAPIFWGSVKYNRLFAGPNEYSSNTMYAMWNARPQDDVVADISKALTQYILDASQYSNISRAPIVPTTGFIEVPVTILRVRWQWLSLPATVLMLGLVFLLFAMVETRRQRLSIWKSSSLPLLYHGLDRQEDHDATMLGISEMEADAQGVKVRLSQVMLSNQEVGWRMLRRGRRV